MLKIFPILLMSCVLNAQVSNVIRNQKVYLGFPYQGVRIIQVDEVNSPNKEENVFIFSKTEKGDKPDKMFFQRFTKNNDNWDLVAIKEIDHDGIISSWGSRKLFADYDKDKSIDALFIYSLSDYNFNTQSVHLLFTKKDEIFEITTLESSKFTENIFSNNFKQLPTNIQNEILDYWAQLDKK